MTLFAERIYREKGNQSSSRVSKVSKLVLTFFTMTEARVLFSKRSIVMKLPVKRAPWFSVYNWQVASCEM